MFETALILVALLVLVFALVAQRIARWPLTAPMVFLGAGVLLSQTGWVDPHEGEHALHILAEATLVILLFLDASQIDLAQFKRQHIWPQRMLLIGLPLSIAIGTVANVVFLPEWPILAAALAAGLLAPTDAALGQSVVSNKRIPGRVRRGLTVESGLNDGLALPIILLLASLLGGASSNDAQSWLVFGASQIVLGPIAGIAVGLTGGWAMLQAHKRGWTGEAYEGVATLSFAALSYLVATQIGGNGFIAAFIAGLCFGNMLKGRCKFVFEFTENEGQILMWAAFLLLGLALVPEAIAHLTPTLLAVILVSLFLVRPLAIWISLLGTDASQSTRLFFGWFGPRGLATALFALLILPEIGAEWSELILPLAINAVWISAVLHGVSAVVLGDAYSKAVERMGACPEREAMPEPFEASNEQVNNMGIGAQNEQD